MDIQKEREAFEAWLKSLNENGRTTYFLGQESTVAWEAWQAAKAQVVPEELIEKLEAAANFMRGMCFDPKVPAHAKEALKYRYEEIEAMIEAQEPAND